jgi:hypothetical protein
VLVPRTRSQAGGGQGHASSGVPPYTPAVHVPPAVNAPEHVTNPENVLEDENVPNPENVLEDENVPEHAAHTPDASGDVPAPTGPIPAQVPPDTPPLVPTAAPTSPPPAPAPRRSARGNKGVPAPRFDGTASQVEGASALTWPWVQASSSSSLPARNYLAEVYAVTGDYEDAFDAARASLVQRHAEVLQSSHAPAWQASAPRTLSEAQRRPDCDRWLCAMRDELDSLQAKGVYEVTALPSGHKPIDLRWVFSYKLRPDGGVERYKARLIAKGFTQQHGVDFFEVWAPTGAPFMLPHPTCLCSTSQLASTAA